MIPVAIGALGMIFWGFLMGLEKLKIGYRPKYLDESKRLEETCCLSNSSERPSANADLKNSPGVIKITAKRNEFVN